MQKKTILITSLIVLASIACFTLWIFFNFMSNDVLESFGTIDEKFLETNNSLNDEIEDAKKEISKKEFLKLNGIALDVESSSVRLHNYIEDLKKDILADQKMDAETMDYSKMDKPSRLLFENNSERGKAFVYEIELYKKTILSKFEGFSNHTFNDSVNDLFKTEREDSKNWLKYEFDEFPLIATYVKLTAIQSDIKNIKLLAYNLLLKE